MLIGAYSHIEGVFHMKKIETAWASINEYGDVILPIGSFDQDDELFRYFYFIKRVKMN
jgi:hypothetical protein